LLTGIGALSPAPSECGTTLTQRLGHPALGAHSGLVGHAYTRRDGKQRTGRSIPASVRPSSRRSALRSRAATARGSRLPAPSTVHRPGSAHDALHRVSPPCSRDRATRRHRRRLGHGRRPDDILVEAVVADEGALGRVVPHHLPSRIGLTSRRAETSGSSKQQERVGDVRRCRHTD
jgi:hypothetical protein